LSDAAASVEAIVEVTEGRLVAGEEREIAGRVWVLAMAVESLPGEIGEGDVVVVGDRPDAQRRAVELGVSLLVTSNGTLPSDEILDHHHIGSIETKVPVTATFDPVGSTATLVVERFRQNGMEPTSPTATMLLGAVLSDTVILNSPTTTERDNAVVDYLGRVLAIDATDFGREMFEATSDVSSVDADDIVRRDAKEYTLAEGRTICIAQIETVGLQILDRRDELQDALERLRGGKDYLLCALMVTDILAKNTKMLVAGDPVPLERAFGHDVEDGTLDLPGVMSRKKQVAPKILGAL
ncbi:MAG TPA: DHHA2 domain-containing protein, partial [Solirubrobacteraceae bacterium]|nr:DHHA2 domain-containing protein [Solirubrobacteraceae bacterium]